MNAVCCEEEVGGEAERAKVLMLESMLLQHGSELSVRTVGRHESVEGFLSFQVQPSGLRLGLQGFRGLRKSCSLRGGSECRWTGILSC